MKDESADKKKSFAEPGLTVHVEYAGNGVAGDSQRAEEVCQQQQDSALPNVQSCPPASAFGDHIVAPYVPPSSDEATKEEVLAQSFAQSLAQSRDGKVMDSRAKSLLQISKPVFTLLAIVLAMVTVFCLCRQRLADQELLDRHSELAQLNEYGGKDHEAAVEWNEAIRVAKRMQLPAKVIADLNLRAARACEADVYGTMTSFDEKIQLNRDTLISRMVTMRQAELREAVTLYSRTDDCQSSQIRAAWDLEESLTHPGGWHYVHMADLFPYSFDMVGGIRRHDNLDSFWRQYPELARRFKDVPKKNRPSDDPLAFEDPLKLLAATKLTKVQAQALIPAMHQNVYGKDFDHVLQAELLLDTVLRQAGYDPFSFEDRLKLAKDAVAANDYQAAIVEYMRCLGIKDDDSTREQFLQAGERMEQQSNHYSSEVRDHQEALALLVKLHQLESSCFGPNSDETLRTVIVRARVLSALRRFGEAEQLLDELPSKQKNLSILQAEKAVVLAASGRFSQAATVLRQAGGADDELAKIYIFTGNSQASFMLRKVHDQRGRAGPADMHPGASGVMMAPDAYGAPTLE